MRTRLLIIFVLFSLAASARGAESEATIVAAATGQGGLAVHLPATDGQIESRLAVTGKVLIQGLALDEKALWATRESLRKAGLYGRASARLFEKGAPLPYASDLVTTLIVDADALGGAPPEEDECLRVVHPLGALCIRRNGVWKKVLKPMPKAYGEWTHVYGGPDNNMRSDDSAVSAPAGLRWISGPPCHQEGAVSNGIRIGSGLAVHDLHLAPWGGDFKFVEARNAFNGLPRFITPVNVNCGKTRPLVVAENRVFTYLSEGTVRRDGKVEGKPGPLVALDSLTGQILKTYDQARPFVWYDGEERDSYPGNNLIFAKGTLFQTSGNTLQAIDANSGKIRWTWSAGERESIDMPSYSTDLGCVAVAQGRRMRRIGRVTKMYATHIVALDARTGRERWRTPLADTGRPKWTKNGAKPISQVVCVGNRVFAYRGSDIGDESVYLAALDGKSGRIIWNHEGQNEGKRGEQNPDVFDIGGQKTDMTVIDGKMYLMSHGVAVLDAATGEKLSSFGFGNSRCDASHAAANLLVPSGF